MTTAELTVATANLGNHRQVFPAIAQSRRLRVIAGLCEPHVVCIQEAKPGIQPAPGYRMVRFAGAVDGPIMIRKDLVEDLRAQEALWIHAGRRGAWVDKWVTSIRLRGWGAIANMHVISQYDDGGRPRDLRGDRWPLAFRYNHAVRSWATTNQTWPRIAAGDTNADLQADQRVTYPGFPAQQLLEAGLVDVPFAHGTLGRRTVDRIFHDQRFELRDHRVIGQAEPFDHDHPVATFRRSARS